MDIGQERGKRGGSWRGKQTVSCKVGRAGCVGWSFYDGPNELADRRNRLSAYGADEFIRHFNGYAFPRVSKRERLCRNCSVHPEHLVGYVCIAVVGVGQGEPEDGVAVQFRAAEVAGNVDGGLLRGCIRREGLQHSAICRLYIGDVGRKREGDGAFHVGVSHLTHIQDPRLDGGVDECLVRLVGVAVDGSHLSGDDEGRGDELRLFRRILHVDVGIIRIVCSSNVGEREMSHRRPRGVGSQEGSGFGVDGGVFDEDADRGSGTDDHRTAEKSCFAQFLAAKQIAAVGGKDERYL